MTLIVSGRPVPDWMGTLEGMVTAGTRVRFSCQACHGWRDVALADLVDRYGAAGSLWDAAPACEAEGCGGTGFFLASPGPGTVFRPLLAESQANRKLGR